MKGSFRSLRMPLVALALVLSGALAVSAADAAAEQAKTLGQAKQVSSSTNTHPDAQWFSEAGMGLFIHWGIAAIQAKGDFSWCMLKEKAWLDGTVTPNEYYGSMKDWHPDKMDFDRMLGAAKAAGFTYAVMVTKHHDGFTFWPSEYGDLGTKYTFHGRDFVKEYVDACRKHGLKVGLYYSPPDWWIERQYRSWAFRGPAVDMDHKPVTLPKRPADLDQKRIDLVRGQVAELLTNYGKIDLIWFDGGRGEIPNSEVRKLQSGIVINRRNGGGGDYGDSEGKLPGSRPSGWFEANLPCWPKRMWSYRNPAEYRGCDAAMVLTMLVNMRAWGGNLLANLGPKADGAPHEDALPCWSEMAAWMVHSQESVMGVRPGPWPEKANLPITLRDGVAYIHFLPQLPERLTGIPDNMQTLALTKQVIPALPAYTDTAIWKNAPQPLRVTLLRTGETLPFEYKNGVLTVTLPTKCRTGLVDVVKLELAKPETVK